MTMTTAALLAGLAGNVFLGEAYPTGNAYLQPFTATLEAAISYDQRPPLETWPASLSLHCLNAKGCADKEVGDTPRKAKRSSYLVPVLESREDKKQQTTFTTFDYIPAREGMDDEHNKTCGLKYKTSKTGRYVDGSDYFDTAFDNCAFDEAIARYQVEHPPKTAAYQVFAVAPEVKLVNIKFGGKEEKRPLSQDEKGRTLASKKITGESDCTTKPGSIGDAVVLVTGNVQGTAQSLRLSTYQDAGCYGHLSRIYVLDLLDGTKVVGTRFATRYIGTI